VVAGVTTLLEKVALKELFGVALAWSHACAVRIGAGA